MSCRRKALCVGGQASTGIDESKFRKKSKKDGLKPVLPSSCCGKELYADDRMSGNIYWRGRQKALSKKKQSEPPLIQKKKKGRSVNQKIRDVKRLLANEVSIQRDSINHR